MSVIGAGRIVTPTGVLDPGWVEVRDGVIVAVGSEPRRVDEDLDGAWLLPGFIDVHLHGGGGHDVTRSREQMAAAVAYHRSRGTTTMLVSLMAQPIDAMCEQLTWAAALTESGAIAGAHLEGPFLATARCGAQNPEHLRAPDPSVAHALLEAGRGAVRTMTVAPELPGARELIADLAAAGVIAAVGHTDATYEQAIEAFAAGAGLATHLFNAMGPFDQRAPGPAIAALDAGAFVELINDGVHLHPAVVSLVARLAGDRLVLITDAISAAGAGDGEFSLGDRAVLVRDGRARLAGSDHLAGSTLTMDESVRRAVEVIKLPIEVASAAASSNPARLLGMSDRCGAIGPGLAADLVVLDGDLQVSRVMAKGDWV